MSKEQYVTFEVARLLKDKGFDWECRAYWHEDDRELIESQSPCYLRNITNPCWFGNTAPTQQMACRWFWEEKGLNINAIYGDYPSQKRSFWMPQIDSLDGCYGVDDEDFFREYDSREDCIEAALEYALRNLI